MMCGVEAIYVPFYHFPPGPPGRPGLDASHTHTNLSRPIMAFIFKTLMQNQLKKACQKMSQQCVPSWDLDDDSPPFAPPAQPLLLPHNSRLPFSSDYEVAELTWKDGNLALLGLRHPPRIGKPIPRYPSPSADAAGGTLECIVDQARGAPSSPDLLSWVGGAHHSAAVDALVPCADHGGGRKRARISGRNCASQGSATQKKLVAGVGNRESKLVTADTRDAAGDANESVFSGTHSDLPASAGDQADGGGSPETENGSFAGTRSLGVDDHDSQDALGEIGMTSISTKRSRVAAIHNQSERKRRDRINQKMKTLQKLLPNSNKTDKASMLDEVIDYLKMLQAQVQMMYRMSAISPMMMPITMQQQQLQIYMIAQMARMSHMSMGLGMMDPNMLGRPGYLGMSPPSSPPPPPPPPPPQMLHPSAFFPIPTASATGAWDASATDWMQQPGGRVFPDMFSGFMGCPTQQPMGSDAYNRMAGIYQLLYGYNQKI